MFNGFVSSQGLTVTNDHVEAAQAQQESGGKHAFKRNEDGVIWNKQETLCVENAGRGIWHATFRPNSVSPDYAEFRTRKDAEVGAVAMMLAYVERNRAKADDAAQAQGFADASDAERFRMYGENLATTAAKLVAQATRPFATAYDVTRYADDTIRADRALWWVSALWNAFAAQDGGHYSDITSMITRQAETRVLQDARNIGSHGSSAVLRRAEDLLHMEADARVADGSLWGYGF